MKSVPLTKQLLVAIVVVVGSYAAFTLLPELFPHPEDFSPYVYSVAFLACVEVWLLAGHKRRGWFYLPILLLCLLALLDESGYGSEVMDIQPFYSTTFHTEVRDLHNAVSLGISILNGWLADIHWNGALFTQFVLLDGVLLTGAFGFAWLLRRGLADAKEPAWRLRTAWLVAGAMLIAGVIATGTLLSLPPDPKNAWLLGYSSLRLGSLVVVLIVSVLPISLLVANRERLTHTLKNVDRFMKTKLARLVLAGVCAAMLAGLAYQLYAPLVFLPDGRVALERLTPLALWLLAVALISLLGWFAWQGRFRRSITQLLMGGMDFLRREPAYFYTLFAILLILAAQLVDKGILPVNELIQTPDFHVTQWGLWTEETFELIGAFMFIAAASQFRMKSR